MRIDGFSSSYPLDRGARPSPASNPYREIQREQELRREQPAPASGSQGFESVPQPRQVENALAAREGNNDQLPARAREFLDSYQRPVSGRVAQALASYGSTANMVSEVDATEVLGLDLYA
ncbi:hypothetical protein [Pseudomonas mangrovi]|uniref:Uncharacterized protein n=1 Tax=Pseudomonas mangrovi TaxID=2161748 RepID=A0A2T5PFJ6_9PSED|nr:hypothetical protein [Pseudomonas mangrovi]PTU76514.1 hypothetical protein DBO85_00180 [Pseudomonas mangrovi]